MRGRILIGTVLVGAALATAQAAGAATFKEYTVGSFPGQQPRYIKAGPDGNLWYADGGTEGGIGRITPQGEVFARFGGRGPVDLAFAPDGSMYWAGDFGVGHRLLGGLFGEKSEWKPAYAAAVAPNGEFWFGVEGGVWCTSFYTEDKGCSVLNVNETGRLTGLVFDHSGNAWGVFNEQNLVHELNPTGENLEVDLPPGSRPARIAVGPEGDLWVTMFGASAVDRITSTGQRTRFPLSPGAGPNDIALGPDGAFWITEYEADKIARMTPSGEVTGEFAVPTPGAHPTGIAAGPDGAMWFTENSTAKIGRIAIDPSTTTPPAGGGGAGSMGGRDTTPPSFTRAPSLHPSRFRDRGRSSGRIPKGSSLTFTMSEAASVKAQVAAGKPGRESHGSCVAVTKSNRGKPHCVRYVEAGSLGYNASAGAGRFAFAGRVSGHTLRPGSYRLTLIATDPAGNSSAPAKLTFTIAP